MQQYHKKCLINEEEDLIPLKDYPRTQLVKSKSSGLVFAGRIPSKQELVDHYNNYPRRGDISEITITRYNELLDGFEKYRINNKILEVGCGGGSFLAEAKKRGWEVHGTEYTPEAAQVPEEKGINMNHGSLNPDNYPDKNFDVIVSIEVIEHINNPLEEVSNIFSLLRKGGLFYVTTPNFNALERFYLGEEYKVIGYPEHLIYFTPKTLNLLMRKVGFEKRKILTIGLNISSFKNSKNQSRIGGIKKADIELRETIEQSKILIQLKIIINFFLNASRLGNAMKGYYVKPNKK